MTVVVALRSRSRSRSFENIGCLVGESPIVGEGGRGMEVAGDGGVDRRGPDMDVSSRRWKETGAAGPVDR